MQFAANIYILLFFFNIYIEVMSMQQQMYDGGSTVGKIIKPIKMEGVKTSIDSTETVIGSTETVLSPLEAKAIHSSISHGEDQVIIYSQPLEKWWIGNHNSAPRMYGATFPTGMRCDPDWSSDESTRPSGDELKRRQEEADKRVYEIIGIRIDELLKRRDHEHRSTERI